MSDYKTTPMAVSVHMKSDSPVFGESTIIVSAEDDGAGSFVVLKSLCTDDNGAGVIKLDLDQLEAVVVAARALIRAHK